MPVVQGESGGLLGALTRNLMDDYLPSDDSMSPPHRSPVKPSGPGDAMKRTSSADAGRHSFPDASPGPPELPKTHSAIHA